MARDTAACSWEANYCSARCRSGRDERLLPLRSITADPIGPECVSFEAAEAPTHMICWFMIMEIRVKSRFPTSLSWRLFPV